jgi:hypothetical protein
MLKQIITRVKRIRPKQPFFLHFQQKAAMSSLVNQPAYSFLTELGISELNAGVFDGSSWKASGSIVDSVCPATNTSIAKVQFGNAEVSILI